MRGTHPTTADRLGTVNSPEFTVPFYLFSEVSNMKKVGIIMGSDSDLPII